MPVEHVSVGILRSPVLQILKNCVSYHWRERIGCTMTCFSFRNQQPVPFPIDMLQFQVCHFNATQPIRGQKEQDSIISFAGWRSAVYSLKCLADVIP